MAKKKTWLGLRWIQANIKFSQSEAHFLEALDTLDAYHPDVMTLNEVGGRVGLIASWAHLHGFLHIQPERQRGMVDDQAILLRATAWQFHEWGVEQMHKEPPGAPTARYLLWSAATFRAAHLPMLLEAYHSLAAVERANRLNPIARTKFYVIGNANVVKKTVELRRHYAKRFAMRWVPVVLAGDLNWSWTLRSWINKTMGAYFLCSHVALRKVPTLGRRSVDIVAKRGGRVRFVRQFAVQVPSDHRALVVDLEVLAR